MKKLGVFNKHTFMRLQKFCIFRIITSAAIAILALLSMATLMPIYHEPYSAEAATGGVVSPVLTFASTNPVASVNMTVGSSTGTFATSNENEKAAFTISTNNYTGYTVILKSTGTVTNLGDGSSHNISTISSSTTSDVFASNGASGQALNNRWGYIPNYYNATGTNPSVNTTTYYPAPTSVNTATLRTTDVANSTNGVDNADDYTIGLGFRADYNMPSGTYTNDTFVLEIVANPVAFVIQYNKNTTDTITNMPANQSGTSAQNHITLSSDTPTRAHYNFLGWCEGEITVTNNAITEAAKDTCTGTNNNIYQPGDDFYFDFTVSNHVSLKAMWEERYYMQDFTPEMCTSMTVNTNLVLYDNRDETEYKIGKLVDESCWLLDNLALDLTDSAVQANLSSATTNASNTSLGYLKGTTSRDPVTDPDGNYATSGVSEEWNDSYSYSDPLIKMDYADTLVTGYGPASTNGKSKVGGYYNFCATSAGSYCYGNGTNQGVGIGDVTEDICPSGWRLPTGDPITGEYWQLCSTVNGSACKSGDGDSNSMTATSPTSFQYQLSTPLAGSFLSGEVDRQDVVGRYWSSTKYSDGGMRYVFIDGQDVGPQSIGSHNVRNWGFTIRCVLKYQYMQDQTPTTMSEILPDDGDTTIFADKRDGKKYSVTKIDEEYWMTRNLNLAGETPLYSSTSNVPAGYDTSPYYTLPTSSLNGFTDNDASNLYNSYSTNCSNNNPCYSYYTYAAATAGTNPQYGEVDYDICPANWRLPSAENLRSLLNLYNTSEKLVAAPFRGFYAGMHDGTGIHGNGTNAYYWSSTAVDQYTAYNLIFTSDNSVFTVTNSGRRRGDAIRCVFKFPYMQDQTEAAMATVLPNIGDTTILADKRDNTKYMVGRLADDNYWMLKNLALDLTATHLTMLQGNTNASDSTLNYLKNGGGTNPYSTTSVSTTWSDSYNMPMINTTKKYTLATSYGVASIDGKAKVGIYYNYCAASAGSYCASSAVVVDEINEDICPAGWRMPTAKPNFGESRQLCSAIKGEACTVGFDGEEMSPTSINSVQYQLSMPLSGSYKDNDNYQYFEECGTVWSSTFHTTGAMRFLGSCSEYVVTQASGSRFRGQSVRCILKSPIMQDQTTANMATLLPNNGDFIKMEDKRDHSKYQVTKISGDYWMTQNLRISGTIPSEYSNFTGNSFNVSEYDLETDGESGEVCNGTSGGYYNACSKMSDDINIGSWYNFYAASAGTIKNNNDTSVATVDICPKGWRLPTGPNTTSGTDFNKLIGNITSGWQNITSNFNYFNAVPNGRYLDGQIIGAELGSWWSATASGTSQRYRLAYNSNTNQVLGDEGRDGRNNGLAIRCIREARTILDINYMQEITPSIAYNTQIGTTTTLKDSRDEQGYTVSKLADDNIWLLDNLALDLADSTVQTNLTSGTTNASNTTLGYLKGATSRNPSSDPNGNYATSGITNNWSANSYSVPILSASGTCQDSNSCANNPATGQWNSNSTVTNYGAGSNKVGIYYNFCAASAGSHCYGDGTNSGAPTSDTTEDICPRGWKIPDGTPGTGEYWKLCTISNGSNCTLDSSTNTNMNATSTSSLQYRLSTQLSGYYLHPSSRNQNNSGIFWTATDNNASYMNMLTVTSTYVNTQGQGRRDGGASIRCVVKR